MKIASIAEVKAHLTDLLKDSDGSPVVITRDGQPVAMLVGLQDEEEIERLVMAHSPRLRSILEQSRQQIAQGQGLSHVEFWAEKKEARPTPRPRKGRRKKAE
jgi:prevent-host-death family protein